MSTEEVRRLLRDGGCPGCGSPAVENLHYQEVFSPLEIEGLLPLDSVPGEGCGSGGRVVFESAAALRGLTSRLKGVDEFVGGLRPGWFVLLRGSGVVDELAARYCFRALLPSSRGGLGGNVFFLDAGMSFDPYFIASLARLNRFSAAESLDRIVVARAFTCYELWSLVADLPRLLNAYGVRLVVISGVFSLFASEDDVKQGEAEQIIDYVRRQVTGLCRDRKMLCIATGGRERPVVLGRLLPHVDVSLEFRERNRRIHGSLLKHPSCSPLDFWVEPENRGRRLTLDSFPQEVVVVG